MFKPIRTLSYTCAALLTVYVVLVGVTMYFASLETRISSDMRFLEGKLAGLESTYYDTIAHMSARDPFAFGYASPSNVRYVTRRTATLSFAPSDTAQ